MHYEFTESGGISAIDRANIHAVSELYGDHHVIDGDIFDAVTDVALHVFLASVDRDDECAQVWTTGSSAKAVRLMCI